MTAPIVIEYLMSGVCTGAVYGLLGIAFGLVYVSTRVFHIALGAIVAICGYAMYAMNQIVGLPTAVATFVAISSGVVIGLLIDVVVYRPLARKSAGWGSTFIASLGVYIVTANVLAMVFGNRLLSLRSGGTSPFHAGGLAITTAQLAVLLCSGLVLLILHVIYRKTDLGLAIRAYTENARLVELLGANTSRLRCIVFAVSSCVGAIAASLLAYDVGVQPHGGLSPMLAGAVAMMIGGRRGWASPFVGGLLVGIVQSCVVMLWSAQWQDVSTFALLGIVLVLRPRGLWGLPKEAFGP